jgi:hypothetical protein
VWVPRGPPQETFDAGLKLLPRSSAVSLLRGALRGLAAGITAWFTPGPGGLKAFNLYALGRLQADVATCERWAGRWGVPGLGEELAEPGQLVTVLLSGKVGPRGRSLAGGRWKAGRCRAGAVCMVH